MIQHENKKLGLEEFPDFEMASFKSNSHLEAYTRKEVLYEFPDSQDTIPIYIIESGFIRLERYSQGKHYQCELAGPGDFIGNYLMLDIKEQKEKAVVLRDVIVWKFSCAQWKDLILSNQYFYNFLLQFIYRRQLAKDKELSILNHCDTLTKVAYLIKRLTEAYGRKIGLGFEYELKTHLRQKDYASMIGIARQSLTTVFTRLADQEIISYNPNRILIRDYNRLAELAKGMLGENYD